MPILSSTFYEYDEKSSLQSRVYESMIQNPNWKKDLVHTIHSDLLEEKYKLYKNLEIQQMLEFYFRECYSFLEKKGALQWNRNQKYIFQLEEKLNDHEYMLGTDSGFIGNNCIGKALSNECDIWKDQNMEFLYKGYHVIEYLVDYYLSFTDFKKFYNKNVYELFRQIGLWSEKGTDFQKWYYSFHDKQWIHRMILEEEMQSGGSICFLIEKWYSGQRKYYEKNKMIQVLYPVLKKKYKIDNEDVFHQKENLNEILLKYEFSELKFDRTIGKKIAELEMNQLTSSEKKRGKVFYPFQYPNENTIFVRKNDYLSPYKPYYFEMDGFVFENIISCVYFKCISHFVISTKEAHDMIQTCKNYDMILEEAMKSSIERQFYKEMYNKLDNIWVQYALLEEKNFKLYPREFEIFKNTAQDIQECVYDQSFANDSLHFIRGLFEFSEFWTEELFEKYQKKIFLLYLWIFYPGLVKSWKEQYKITQDEIPNFLQELTDTWASWTVSCLKQIHEIDNVQQGTELYQFIRKLDNDVQNYIIVHLKEWQELMRNIFHMRKTERPHLLHNNVVKGKNYKSYVICKSIVMQIVI